MEKQKVFDLDQYRKNNQMTKAQPEMIGGGPVPESGDGDGGPSWLAVIKGHKWLILAVALLLAVCLMPTPAGLTTQGKYAIGLWVFLVVCFLTEAVPLPITALIVGSYQIIAGINTHQEVPRTFMDDAVVFIIGVLMMGAMLVKYNIHNKIALHMLRLAGARVDRVVLGMVGFCALSAGFITEHATVSIMFPIGVGIVSLSGGISQVPRLGKLLMLAISYGVIIGGVATPSGGARNALTLSYLNHMGINVGYGCWMLMALPFTLLMIPLVSFWLLRLFKPEVQNLTEVLEKMQQEMDAAGPMTTQAKLALFIFLAVLLGWVFFSQQIGVGTVAMIGIVAATVLGLVDWSYLQQKTQWGVVILYAGAVSMGKTLVSTGAAAWLAKQLLVVATKLGVTKGLPLVAITTFMTAVTTNTMADGPTVAVLSPVFLKAAELTGTSPLVMGVATSLGAAFSFLMVIATPANAIVYGPGFLRASDFLKAGGVLFVISLAVVVLLAGVWWRVLGLW